jgi:Domain of unknown function DUF29
MGKPTLYDQDFFQWTEKQAEYIRQGCWAELDVENLVEELESLGRSEQKELGSYLQLLMMHLLKCQHQPDRRTQSWDNTISNCRDKIQDCIEDMPSLQRFLQDSEWVEKHYRRSRRDAAKEMKKPIETFPSECPYTMDQILDPGFLI